MIVSSSRRGGRLAFQLAALVDLLFVMTFLLMVERESVMHAQVAEQEDNAMASEESRRRAEVEKKAALAAEARAKEVEAGALKNQAKWQNAITKLEGDKADIEAREKRLKSENEELQSKLSQALASAGQSESKAQEAEQGRKGAEEQSEKDRQEIGAAMQQLFRIPKDAIESRTGTLGASELRAFGAELSKMKSLSPGNMIHYIRETSQLRNLCDVWEVHLYKDGRMRLRIEKEGPEMVSDPIVDANDVALKLSKHINHEPASTVLIMITWENVNLDQRTALTDGLKVGVLRVQESKDGHPKTTGQSGPNRVEEAP